MRRRRKNRRTTTMSRQSKAAWQSQRGDDKNGSTAGASIIGLGATRMSSGSTNARRWRGRWGSVPARKAEVNDESHTT